MVHRVFRLINYEQVTFNCGIFYRKIYSVIKSKNYQQFSNFKVILLGFNKQESSKDFILFQQIKPNKIQNYLNSIKGTKFGQTMFQPIQFRREKDRTSVVSKLGRITSQKYSKRHLIIKKIFQMGTSCISKPKYKNKHQNDQQIPSSSKQSFYTVPNTEAMHIQLVPQKQQLSQYFPRFQIPLLGSQQTTPPNWQLINDILEKIVQCDKDDFSQTNYIPLRMFNHSSIDVKKYFRHYEKYKIKELDLKTQNQLDKDQIRKITVLQSIFYNVQAPQICMSPAHILTITPTSYQTRPKLISDNILPALFLHNCSGKIQYTRITSFQEIRKITLRKYQNKKSQVGRLKSNPFLNGLHWFQSEPTSVSENPLINFLTMFQLPTAHSQNELLLYINPLITFQARNQIIIGGKQTCNFSTYLELKSFLESPSMLSLPNLMKKYYEIASSEERGSKISSAALFSIYIFIFAIKFCMETEGVSLPQKIMQSLFSKVSKEEKNEGQIESSDNKEITNCLDFIKILFFLSIEDLKPNEAQKLCKKIIQDAIINSNILLEAYLLDFSLEINQKDGILRQNPISNKILSFSCRQLYLKKANLNLVNLIKAESWQKTQQLNRIITEKKENEDLNSKRRVEQFQQWCKTCKKDFIRKAGQKTQILTKLQKNEENQEGLNIDELISLEEMFKMEIIKFICIVGLGSNIFQAQSCDLSCIGLIYEYWNPIFNEFLAPQHTYCSGQLAIVILTMQGLIKSLDPESAEDVEYYLLKAIQIWNRIYRDPLSKHEAYIPNQWYCLIIKILLKTRFNSPEQKSLHQINYLNNIYSCINHDSDEGLMSHKQLTLQWVIRNLPMMNLSGVFYLRIQLMAEEDKSSTLLKTGGSILDSPCDQLSNRSNFSETHSSGNNSLSKTRKKNRKKFNDSLSLLEHRTKTYGVYQWGKGVKSVPLIHILTQKMDVFRIACGNYHVLITASDGVYGWGQNYSGQLGETNQISITTIKLVEQMQIDSKEDVEISCGNEHSAVLINKARQLRMWGQKQGGITSGNGHKFDNVSCGGLHTLGILDGDVYTWGRGEGGQLGQKIEKLKTKKKEESTQFFIDSPTKVEGLHNIKEAVCGDAHSVVLSQEGEVFVFGFCYQGQLGLGLTGQSEVYQIFEPVKLDILDKNGKVVLIQQIYAGPTFTFFKSVTGELYSCGLNDYSQLGFEKVMKVFQKKKFISHTKNIKNPRLGEVQFSRPKKVDIFSQEIEIKDIYCGENHCLAKVQFLKNQQMIMGWGHNRSYQITSQIPAQILGPRTIDNLQDFHFDEICCGNNFSLGLSRDPGLTRRKFQDKIAAILLHSSLFHQQ